MKKLLILFMPLLFACGTEQIQAESFAAEEIVIKRQEVCNNLDASVREELDEISYKQLLCTDIEEEVVCDGEWCVIHRSCRVD